MEVADKQAQEDKPKRTLAVFLDGTWNVEDNNTNVWRLYSLCAQEDSGHQLCFYTKGVGTDYGSKFKGGVLGMGLTTLIRQAYDWLIANYKKDDRIFIFGFSRGAYAARSLAGLIARCGVPNAGSPVGVDEIYSRYQKGNSERTLLDLLRQKSEGGDDKFSLFEKWMIEHCVSATVTMVGVWDTVGSLVGNYDYLETGLRIPIRHVFHALAIDEHRRSFSETLLTRNTHSDVAPAMRNLSRPISEVEQRWFVGAHANVGGGYASDPISQGPLAWIAAKAISLGLKTSKTILMDKDPWSYPVANSFWEFAYHAYWFLRLGISYYRPVGLPDRVKGTVTTQNVNETIDASVFERWRRDTRYRPKNLKEWAARYKVDPSTITTAVLAKDPNTPAP